MVRRSVALRLKEPLLSASYMNLQLCIILNCKTERIKNLEHLEWPFINVFKTTVRKVEQADCLSYDFKLFIVYHK